MVHEEYISKTMWSRRKMIFIVPFVFLFVKESCLKNKIFSFWQDLLRKKMFLDEKIIITSLNFKYLNIHKLWKTNQISHSFHELIGTGAREMRNYSKGEWTSCPITTISNIDFLQFHNFHGNVHIFATKILSCNYLEKL